MTDGNKLVENLITYAKENLYLNSNDEDFIRLRLYKFLLLKPSDIKKYKGSGELLSTEKLSAVLEDYLVTNYSVGDDIKEVLSEVFAVLTPMPSQIDRNFKYLREKMGPKAAVDYFYGISTANVFVCKENYSEGITDERFRSRIYFSDKKRGGLVHLDTDIRLQDNARVINYEVGARSYDFGYLKYNDFSRHAAFALPYEKTAVVDKDMIDDVTSFVEYIPEFAAISSVAGKDADNIATLDKFFLISEDLPVYSAKDLSFLSSEAYPDADISIIDHPVAAIKFVTFNRNTVIELTHDLIRAWDVYVDESSGIGGNVKRGANRSFFLVRMLGDGRFSVIVFFTRTDDFDLYSKKNAIETLFSTRYFPTALCGRFIIDEPSRLAVENAKRALVKKGKIDIAEACPQFVDFFARVEETQSYAPNEKKATVVLNEYLLGLCDEYLSGASAFSGSDNATLALKTFLSTVGIR